MKICRSVVVAVLLAAPLAAMAQQAAVSAEDASKESGAPGVDEVIAYIANELVIAGGVGFRDVQLGDTMQSVIDRWGEPAAVRKAGMLGQSHELLYTPDEFSAIVFTGKDRIRTISVKGSSAAAFRTSKGGRFGMKSLTIARLYNTPAKGSKENRYEYPQRGINFFFVEDRLDKLVVYDAEN